MVVWTSAWLHGVAAADDVLDALKTWADMHDVAAADDGTATVLDLPGPGETAAAPALLLGALRRAGAATGRLVLPVPGDMRGLGGPGAFGLAALDAGQAAVIAEVRIGLVPRPVADGVLRWTVFDLPQVPPVEQITLAEAEYGLAAAMREAATTLANLDIARHRPGVREEIDTVLRSQPSLEWPQGMPPRSLRVLQRAAEVQAILDVAAGDAPGGALSASAARARAEALRPLSSAVRRARCAAVDEAVRALADHAGHR
jgi:hypothetical protein